MKYSLEEITNAIFAKFIVRGDVDGLNISAAQAYEEIKILRSCADKKRIFVCITHRLLIRTDTQTSCINLVFMGKRTKTRSLFLRTTP